jgi:hypothetical protein
MYLLLASLKGCRLKLNNSRKGARKALFMFSLVLISCSPARIGSDGTSTEAVSRAPSPTLQPYRGTPRNAVSQTPSPTLQPYWGLDPSLPDPIGGWLTYHAEEVNLVFEYPSVYEHGECGRMFMAEKVVGDREYHLIGFGSSIRISVYEKWSSELDEMTRKGQPPSEQTLLTDVETFSLGGKPAFRYINLIIQDPKAFEYNKIAWTFYRDKLYLFSYMGIADLARCGAPPLSEEAVYEHMLSSVAFLE